ncbi:MFS transporter [Sphingomonas ginsenosidimutans]|jgi:MFS family permease|uniref:MFS transporter n=1 Tax=Sphingomonas ginsenosidimutans TaxID=862134 RepID=A0A2A4HWV7_9SPHN|nr:MFS transporter [Sphingomonas ginsenosidimutans]MEE2916934.1 MFS transporter [Pseudomonadota bacterium]PCG08850.1 MFS transporter [Sphingomonas ginsenosidimutans]
MDRTPAPAVHPLRIANFRAYWLSRFSGTIAISAQAIIIGWQVYGIARTTMDIRQAAFMLGLIGLIQFVPLFVLTPLVGLVADSVDRRWIIRGTTALLVANAAVLGILTWAGLLTLPFLFLAAVLVGVARAFAGPAYSALAPNLVPKESLPTAIAISSIAWQTGMIAGPSVGGLLFAIHPDVAYATISALLAVALGLMFLIGPVPQPPAQKDRRPLQRILDGFSYVRRNRLVLAAITLDLFAVLLAGATALLPIYARDILHVGASGLGFLAAGMGIGAATTAIFFSFRPMTSNVGVKMLVSVVVFGLAILTFGLSTSFWVSLVALIVAGGADMVSVYVRTSLIQLHTPDAMRGRVSAVSQLTISASNELGEAESGLMASLLGPVGAVVVGGVGAIAITLVWAYLFPELKRARTFDPPAMPEHEPLHGVAQP